jgi:hypothetical protein
MRRLPLVLLFVAGCTPLSYVFTPAGRSVVSKPKGCTFEVRTSQPSEGYEEIGTLEHYNGKPTKSVDELKKAIGEQVCNVGGDAVVAIPDDKGELNKAVVVKWVSYADPVAPTP